MLSFFLEKLSIAEKDIQFIDSPSISISKEKKLIFVEKILNKTILLQSSIENIEKNVSVNQYVIFQFETLRGRENRIKSVYPKFFARIILFIEFIIHRAIPRLPFLGSIYKKLTKGRIRILSKAEGLGRLVYAGFEIILVENIDGLCTALVTTHKIKNVLKKPSFGILFKMTRIGKNGKKIGVYKIRTMHPYSEFLQEYILKVNGYGEKGKPKNDFRVTSWGRILRKYWLDEIPQILNVLKLEMKLVGLRPVSEVYFNELNENERKLRILEKPGCIPPYVAFNLNSSRENVLLAEHKYLEMKKKSPNTTDYRIFFLALKHIIFSKKRGT
jgi:lipopolysaccharide/colanic/teichoic acid biosynthesis glycosyltransferase